MKKLNEGKAKTSKELDKNVVTNTINNNEIKVKKKNTKINTDKIIHSSNNLQTIMTPKNSKKNITNNCKIICSTNLFLL